jgi:hypothetical protein
MCVQEEERLMMEEGESFKERKRRDLLRINATFLLSQS